MFSRIWCLAVIFNLSSIGKSQGLADEATTECQDGADGQCSNPNNKAVVDLPPFIIQYSAQRTASTLQLEVLCGLLFLVGEAQGQTVDCRMDPSGRRGDEWFDTEPGTLAALRSLTDGTRRTTILFKTHREEFVSDVLEVAREAILKRGGSEESVNVDDSRIMWLFNSEDPKNGRSAKGSWPVWMQKLTRLSVKRSDAEALHGLQAWQSSFNNLGYLKAFGIQGTDLERSLDLESFGEYLHLWSLHRRCCGLETGMSYPFSVFLYGIAKCIKTSNDSPGQHIDTDSLFAEDLPRLAEKLKCTEALGMLRHASVRLCTSQTSEIPESLDESQHKLLNGRGQRMLTRFGYTRKKGKKTQRKNDPTFDVYRADGYYNCTLGMRRIVAEKGFNGQREAFAVVHQKYPH